MIVYFGTPTTGSPRIEWCASVMAMANYEAARGADGLLYPAMQFQLGAYISKNRNALTALMYEAGADALLQIDHDISFPPDTLRRMVEAMEQTGAGVVAGNVPLQLGAPTSGFNSDGDRVHHNARRGEGLGRACDETESWVDTIASSCVLVHRRVFDKISRHAGADLHEPGDAGPSGAPWFGPGTWWMLTPVWDPDREIWVERGEDFSFSWRVREVGEAPMLLMWDLGLEHFKPTRLSGERPEKKNGGADAITTDRRRKEQGPPPEVERAAELGRAGDTRQRAAP